MSIARCCADLRLHLEAIRDGAGPDVDILLDLNFNAKTEGYLKILRAIADLDIFWIENRQFQPGSPRLHPPAKPASISSCETLLGLREFLPISANRPWTSRSSTRHGMGSGNP